MCHRNEVRRKSGRERIKIEKIEQERERKQSEYGKNM